MLINPSNWKFLADDHRAPPLENGDIRGGTGVLQAQSDCPFRAYATQRLGAADLTPPRPGLDARDRGSLLHQALEFFLARAARPRLPFWLWAAMNSIIESTSRLPRRLSSTPNAIGWGMSPASQALEAECLKQAMNDWLDLEKQREPFRVNQLEAKVYIELR